MITMEGLDAIINILTGLVQHPVATIVILVVVGVIMYTLEEHAKHKIPDSDSDRHE
jgi:hypothetical protein